MPEPELYNVLHIGPEHSSPLDHKLVQEVKKTRITKVVMGVGSGLVLLSLFFVGSTVKGDINNNQQQIESLIDEVGSLNQANFNLQQQVTSQDAVLKSIATDFTGLGSAIQGGDKDEIASLFTNILQKFSESHGDAGNLSTDVSAAESADSTYDVLILGTHGSLTDTIMVASINATKKKISLFSVPRDLYINGRKINAYYGSYGVDTLERMVQSVTGLQIDNFGTFMAPGMSLMCLSPPS